MLAILDATFILKSTESTLHILTGRLCQLSRDDDRVRVKSTVCGIWFPALCQECWIKYKARTSCKGCQNCYSRFVLSCLMQGVRFLNLFQNTPNEAVQSVKRQSCICTSWLLTGEVRHPTCKKTVISCKFTFNATSHETSSDYTRICFSWLAPVRIARSKPLVIQCGIVNWTLSKLVGMRQFNWIITTWVLGEHC